MSGTADHIDVVDAVFRDAYGQAVATLARVFGDISVAEDAVQDAFAVALERWPQHGIPPNAVGWIITTARRRAIDRHRRAVRGRQLEEIAGAVPGPADVQEELSPVDDDRLRLIFTCCHPALAIEARVALTLRLLGGLTTKEIADAFLVSEAAMGKRLVRAKYKIRVAAIPYRVPSAAELPGRLNSVLAVIYLAYNAGADDPDRAGLRQEAIRLGRRLRALLPHESEVAGLLALMVLHEARTPARTPEWSGRGTTVRLSDQDRTLWDQTLIREGHAIVYACVREDDPGPYQVQAAIQAVHCAASSIEETNWSDIVALYDHLLILNPSPVVALNRAIALGEVEGADVTLAELEPLERELNEYHMFHATRGMALERLGRVDEARIANLRAADLAPNERIRHEMEDRVGV